MSKRTNTLGAILVPLMLSNPVFAQETSADTVVSSVNGVDITIGHMIVLRDALPEQYRSLPADVLFDGVLDQLVQQTLLSQQVTNPDASIELRLQNERRSLLAAQAIQSVVSDAVTSETLQEAYDSQFAIAEPSKEYNASHILVDEEDQAAALIEELTGGADFADLAKTHSTGPSGPSGGELGWFGAGAMVTPFENAVFAMEKGAISVPIQTQFGWHVIKLNDVRTLDAPDFETVKGQLEEQIRAEAIDAAITALMEGAQIAAPDLSGIDRSVINNLDLISK